MTDWSPDTSGNWSNFCRRERHNGRKVTEEETDFVDLCVVYMNRRAVLGMHT